MGLTLLLGGARSGKSALAVRTAAAWGHPVTVIVTAEVRDDEMAERVRRHRAERPAGWRVVEAPLELLRAIEEVQTPGLVLDCLTLWVSNLIERDASDEEVVGRAREAAAAACGRTGNSIAISNEVGSGIVPDNALARRYRDLLGAVNREWADAADRAALVVAGRVLPLHASL